MEFNQSDINSIIKAKENDNLVVFIGAGVSKFSEVGTIKFPDWGQLIKHLQEELQTSENDYLKVAQLYYLQFGEYRLYEKLKSLIPLHAKPSEIHEKIFALNPKFIITTNWDNLLEETYKSKGLIYDCVRSDSDLVKSTLPRKVIKIHGDLDAHNIVFKEDDYFNFSLNSPLIENFLKNILSTNTVVFLGYSYSDYDLKVISKWIERQSKVSPPRFLLNKSKNSIEELYLSNHGIRVINPVGNISYDYEDVYKGFLDILNSKENISNKLDLILDKGVDSLNNEEKLYVVDYIYSKLASLVEFEALLPEQIMNILVGCSLEYHINCFGINFTSYNKDSSRIYKVFFNILTQLKNSFEIYEKTEIKEKVVFILEIFLMANCIYIKNGGNSNGDWISIQSYLIDVNYDPKEKNIYKDKFDGFIRFSNEEIDTYLLDVSLLDKEDMSPNAYEEITSLFNNKLNESLKLKEYYKAVIHMFNMDLVNTYLHRMQPSNSPENSILLPEQTEWEGKISYYPTEIRKYIQPLQDFLSFKTIYKFHSESIVDSNKIIQLEKNNLNGGVGFTSNYYKSNDRCIQILRFCANNGILIDNFSEFRALMQSYVKSKIEIQLVQIKLEVQEHDLFILIKYFDTQDLRRFLTENLLKKDKTKESLTLNFDDDEKIYLNEVFNNLLKLHNKIDNSFYETTTSKALSNILIILALVSWSETEYSVIVDRLVEHLLNNQIAYDVYRSINYHILLGNNLYHNKYESISKLLDIPLYKVISREGFSFLESQAFKSEFVNIIHYMRDNSIQYSNEKLVDRVLFNLDLIEDEKSKRIFCNDMILKYILVSDERIGTKIKYFINKIRKNSWLNDDYQEIFLELLFNIFDCQVNDDFINFLTKWVDNYYSLNTMSDFKFTELGGTKEMLIRLKELYEIKDLSEFENIYIGLKEKEIKIRSDNDLNNRKKFKSNHIDEVKLEEENNTCQD